MPIHFSRRGTQSGRRRQTGAETTRYGNHPEHRRATPATDIDQPAGQCLQIHFSRQYRLGLCDTGCGIDMEKGELIFQRFEKLNSMNPGFGLGLSICRSLTTLLGGKIYLDTQYTGGARFVVELPLHPPV